MFMLSLEPATVQQVHARRTDIKGNVEYLVSWVEYPGSDTWEGLENLRNVPEKLKEYEDKIKKT